MVMYFLFVHRLLTLFLRANRDIIHEEQLYTKLNNII